jgi:endonuclease YncB( thermonuclease family)
MPMPNFYILFLLIFSFSAQAEIFQWVDAKGNEHFSDKSHLGAKTFQVDAGYSYYRVKKVYDGDTILLANGKKVRFLGINTPEVEGRNKSVQAGGDLAKQWLTDKLKGKKVRLEKDIEKKDKYGRLLAHVFTENKEHLNLELVRAGLASVNIYPPSLKYISELVKAEQQAERNSIGIWGYDEYAPKQVAKLKQGSVKGWQRVVGKIKKIRHTRKNSYLDFSDRFRVKISKKSHKFFPKLDDYVGKRVEVRGWISKRKKNYSMFVRHPTAIKIK